MKKCVESLQNKDGHNVDKQRFSVIDFVLLGKIGLWQIFQQLMFVVSGKKCHCQSH